MASNSSQPADSISPLAANGSAAATQKPDSKQDSEQDSKPDAKPQSKPDQKEEQSDDPPGGFDASKVPHAPPGYTVRITFHRAAKLPMADLSTLSSDPYLTADLTTNLPSRHKEDPVLRFRSHTIWRSLEPVWNEEWILQHVPSSGFKLKIRIYDEDSSDRDDRLGNVHIHVDKISESWQGIHNQSFEIKKRSGSWRAYAARSLAVCFGRVHHMSGDMYVSIECLGKSPGNEGGRVYTYGKQYWCKHYSPILGRLVGAKDAEGDQKGHTGAGTEQASDAQSSNHNAVPTVTGRGETMDPSEKARVGMEQPNQSAHDHDTKLDQALGKVQDVKDKSNKKKRESQRYNFQANQFQLRGPVPPELYHRYVEFRPFIKSLFTAKGVRGIILSKALHHQHTSVYNFNRDTRYGVFEEPCKDMTLKFLELAHYAEGGRMFTYVITLDGLLRFTETGKEFGIDLLSKHTMHADRNIYIAFSGEFFIRRLRHPYRPTSGDQSSSQTNEQEVQVEESGMPSPSSPEGEGPKDPANYELIIDNDSGTYRPNAKLLPTLKHFLEENFPGLKVVTLDCQADEELMKRLKNEQRARKKREQGNMVYQQVSRSSSFSSDDEERLNDLATQAERNYAEGEQAKSGTAQPASGDEKAPAESSDKVQTHKLGEALAPFTGGHDHIRAALGEKR